MMGKVRSLKKRITDPRLFLLDFYKYGLIKLSDRKYLELRYKQSFGYYPDFDNPKTFNEKIQWMKLYYRRPDLPDFVDKIEAKKKVAKIIGDDYIIPTIGAYNKFEDIDFNKLPRQFVIKCTHDCASVIICRDKSKFDINSASEKINKALKVKYYGEDLREWVYSQIKPRIIIEKLMKNDNTEDIVDYKFFCFNGEPRIMYVSSGLENHATASIDFADMNYNLLDIERADYRSLGKLPPKPASFDEMKRLARLLSKGFPQVRVDFYDINGKPFFGELTFYTCGGMVKWKKHEYDEKLGKMMKMPKKFNDI